MNYINILAKASYKISNHNYELYGGLSNKKVKYRPSLVNSEADIIEAISRF